MVEAVKARPKLWTPEDLAEYLNVPVGWIYKRTRKNGPEAIPHIKLGKYLRFDQESVAFRDWIARHRVGDTAGTGDSLTSTFSVNRVRATEETGHVR